ncbi:MAG TPA: TetR/AcrR family transcriptional regulator [Ktedonobacteraceae bacterium]|nr:TetR/AcrR family transcriptional regulator [Ktedonobacteraceae bacterium]
MTQPVSNLRVRRTQKLLREALIELIEERDFESLTVSDLASHAMVSRAAFYRMYQDKYDLVEQIFEEAMNALLKALNEMGQKHPSEMWVTFFEHIAAYARLYRSLLGKKGSPWFVRKMRTSLAEMVKERGRVPHGPDPNSPIVHNFSDEFVPDIVAAMFVEMIIWWLEQENLSPPKEIATRSSLLASAIFKEVSTWQSAPIHTNIQRF